MKLNKSKAAAGQFVAVGSRGVVVTDLTKIEEPLKLGTQPILKKERGENHSKTQLWNSSCSWITSSKAKNSEGVAEFSLLTINGAVKKGLAKIHKGLKFKGPRGTFTADVICAKDWDASQKQPQYMGVIKVTAGKYSHRRIESRLIKEADGSESRNKSLVAKLVRDNG